MGETKDPNRDENEPVVGELGQQPTPAVLGEKTDASISPEIVERVMAKVTDLYESGFGLTGLQEPYKGGEYKTDYTDFQILSSVLEKGLFGTWGTHVMEGPPNLMGSAKDLSKDLRSGKTSLVFGNIIGRDIGRNLIREDVIRSIGIRPDRERDEEGEIYGYWARPVSIIYDVSDKKEVSRRGEFFGNPKRNEIWAKDDYKNPGVVFNDYEREFMHQVVGSLEKNHSKNKEGIGVDELKDILLSQFDPSIESAGIYEKSRKASSVEKFKEKLDQCKSYKDLLGSPNSDNGFIMGKRIAPRKFTGVVWRVPSKDSFHTNGQTELAEVQKIVEVFSTVSDKTGKDRFLPIYDQFGNLLWPKQMSYEEVRQLVGEREAKKEQKE